MSPRIVTVFGATGLQGSCITHALLKDGTFAARAVTRNASSDAAKAIKAAGAEVVEANLLSQESVEKAIAGSEAIFGVRFLISIYFASSYMNFSSGYEYLGRGQP